MITEICKKNALIYSEKVCTPLPEYGGAFPEYFDWADHIATDSIEDYPYYLNKFVSDVIKLVTIFKMHFQPKTFTQWKKEWYDQTLAAAWIHDIGMVESRDRHGFFSARFLFENNDWGFDFDGIGLEDKVKIGLLCIRHDNSWTEVCYGMKQILEENNITPDILNDYFEDLYPLYWELEFSGKLISTADSLRHRGTDLRNNLKNPFMLWSMCPECKMIYSETRPFCSTPNCSSKPETKAVVSHYINKSGFNPNEFPDIVIFRKDRAGKVEKIKDNIKDTEVTALVRENNQLYIQGDMSLYNVNILEFENWLGELTHEGIDWSELEENIFLQEYKTVMQVTIERSNQEAAMFALSKYITRYLHQNLSAEEDSLIPDFSCKTVLHLILSDSSNFVPLLEDASRSLNGMVKHSVRELLYIFNTWDELNKIVLPVQVIENTIEVIQL